MADTLVVGGLILFLVFIMSGYHRTKMAKLEEEAKKREEREKNS